MSRGGVLLYNERKIKKKYLKSVSNYSTLDYDFDVDDATLDMMECLMISNSLSLIVPLSFKSCRRSSSLIGLNSAKDGDDCFIPLG